jgi:hypothetical protein
MTEIAIKQVVSCCCDTLFAVSFSEVVLVRVVDVAGSSIVRIFIHVGSM